MKIKQFSITAFSLAASLLLIASLTIPVRAQDEGPTNLGTIVPIDSAETPSNPDIAWGGTGANPCNNFLVVYDRTKSATDKNIWGRYVANNGAAAGPGPFQITSVTSNQSNPAVAYNLSRGNYLVAWEDNRNNGQWEIYAQFWNCAKQKVTDPIRVTIEGHEQRNPDVACGYSPAVCWVVWDDNRNGNWDIYGQVLSVDGAKVGPNVPITSNTLNQRYPAITHNPEPTGCGGLPGFAVAWGDARNTITSGMDIYIQLLDDTHPCGGGNQPVTKAVGDQVYPDLAYGTDNDVYQVVWEDHRNKSYDIYGRRVTSAGKPIFGSGDFAISNNASNQYKPAVCYGENPPNHFNTVWHDNRAVNLNIYGQRTSGAGGLVGTLAGVNYLVSGKTHNESRPAIAYSITSNRYFAVWMNDVNGIEGIAIWWP